jgi:gliding motility-associated-like protein
VLRKLQAYIFSVLIAGLAFQNVKAAGHTVNLELTHVSCYNVCDGKAKAIVSGAVGPILVKWRGNGLTAGTVGDSIMAVCPGIYTVEVIDQADNSSTGLVTFEILNAPPFFWSVDKTPILCFGDSLGEITVNVSGGTPPYHYQWNTAATDTFNTIDSLFPGTYAIEVTDSLGCTFRDTIVLASPDSLEANISGIDATCKNKCDGQVMSAPLGGTPPYRYLWSTGDTLASINQRCEGKYLVTITDAHACTVTDSFIVGAPDTLKAAVNITPIDCKDSCTGSIAVIPTGGVKPYHYSWAPAGFSGDSLQSGLCAGDYTITLTDSNGCYVMRNEQLLAPQGITMSDSVFSAGCNTCNGTIKVFPTGGQAPYKYLWDTGNAADTNSVLSGICAGVYTVTVTDANLCSVEMTYTVDDSAGIVGANAVVKELSCFGGADGRISVQPIGGTAPFTYLWTPGGQTDSTRTGLAAGNYFATITDATGCKKTIEVNLKEQPAMSSNATVSPVSCPGSCDGSIVANISGGSAPFQYVWQETGGTNSSESGLCAGVYHLTVTDANGCVFVDSFTVDTTVALTLNTTSGNASCYETCDGTASVVVSGGVQPYTYRWSDGSLSATANALCSGMYQVTVEDANGCTASASVNVTAPTEIQAIVTATPANCGFNDGKATIAASGGAGSYTYLWFNGTTKDSLTGLEAGVYHVTVSDTNGCSSDVQFAIENIGASSFSTTVSSPSCSNKCDGTALVQPSSGFGPYRFKWSTGDSTASVSGLCAGVYYVEMTDGSGCVGIERIELTAPAPVSVDVATTTPTCYGDCDGKAIATVNGGTPPYQYAWSNGVQINAAGRLCSGTYLLTVTDTNNCSVASEVIIDTPEQLNIAFERVNVNCFGDCSGKLTALVEGGTAPYTYSWSNGATTKTASGLCVGTYSLMVTDANGCVVSDTMAIGANPAINASVNTTNASCGVCDGTATITPTGGNGAPYTYSWVPGNYNTASVNDLCAGIYSVTITDNAGCTELVTVIVNNTGGPTFNDTAAAVSCYGECDGIAAARASGNAPLSYLWNDPMAQTADTATGLCAGAYQVLVRDNAGCMTAKTVTVPSPDEIELSPIFTIPDCPGDSLGAISIAVNGGIPPYNYLWSTGVNDTLSTIDTLKAGTYSVQVTDSLNCTVHDTFELTDPPAVHLTLSATPALCHGACDGTAEVVIVGGRKPYQVSWNDPNAQSGTFASGLCSGFVVVTVTDAAGCTVIDSIELVEPGIFTLGFVPTNPTCASGEDGSITLTPAGGIPPYTYRWSNGQTGNTATGLGAGVYTVTGIDSKGCVAYDTITLNNPAALTATFNKTLAQCDSANGSITVTPAGGSGNYSYLWKTIPFQTTQTATRVPAGTVELIVTDNISMCSRTFNVTLNNTGGPATTLLITDESCFGACDGSAAVQSATATAYQWNDPLGQTSATASGLCSGTYTVISSDAANCKTVDTLTIQTKQLEVLAHSVEMASCFGDCDGSAAVIASGGKVPYTYSWNTNPVQSDSNAIDLCAGSYEVVATDSAGCAAVAAVIINEPKELTINTEVFSSSLCANPCNGTARALAMGGTAPYRYAWSNGERTSSVENLCEGTHTLIITDAKGCTAFDTIEVETASPILANAVIGNPLCGMYNGMLTLNPTGGTGPYRFQWSNGATTARLTNLFAGVYSVEITDKNNCSATFTYFLNNPNAPGLTFAKNTVKCTGDCNGEAMVTPAGGVAPYTYRWDYVPTSTSNTLSDLCSGVYLVKVTDAVGCIAYGTDTVREPLPLIASPVVDNQGCGGACLGVASANPSGGTAPYRFEWNTVPVKSTNQVDQLCAGTYSVIVTDTNDCQYEDSLTIIPPPALIVDSITAIAASCNDNADGQAAVYVSGGTAPYRYFWNNGATTAIVENTSGGTKVVLVTDTNGCEIQDTVDVGVVDTVLVSTGADFDACFGAEIELIAQGEGVISYQWFAITSGSTVQVGNDDSILVTLNDTTMYVIRGSNDASPACVDRDTVMVTAIPPPLVDAGPDETIVQGESVVLDDVTPFIPHGLYLWQPGTGLDDSTVIRPRATPRETTTYVLSVTDELGCTSSDTITIVVEAGTRLYNGFSPNGDGVNDFWTIPEIENFPDAVVEIYSRWGEQVFRSVGYKKKWDGTYKGEPLPDGTYYYVIEFNGNRERETGPVTLIR